MKTTKIHARPYDMEARGFYFETEEEFAAKSGALRNAFGAPVEEFELEYIEGDDAALFRACRIDQTNLDTWFNDVEPLTDAEKAALFYLTDCIGEKLADALEKIDGVCLTEEPEEKAAEALFWEMHGDRIPEDLHFYINTAGFLRDLKANGDFHEFHLNGRTWTVTNGNDN